MIEKAVVNASVLTVCLAILGFSVLTLVAHSYRSTSIVEKFSVLDKSTEFANVFQKNSQWITVRFFGVVSKGLNNRKELPFAQGTITTENNEIASPKFQMFFILAVLFVGFISIPVSHCCNTRRMKNSKEERRNKRKNKTKKRYRKRPFTTIKRVKKRYKM